jgi:putative Mn2+ efflux pump MntP
MSIIIVIITAISLSMDAFSLSLAYGTLNIEKKQIYILSTIVGIFHFIMPLIGMIVGSKIIYLLPIQPNVLVFIVLFLIGFQMIIESFNNKNNIYNLTLKEMLMFGFAVSIDSFTLGIGLEILYNYPIIAALIFSLISGLFTFIGLKIGKKINSYIGKLSTVIGGLVLIIIGILYIM